jgi:undecaprenyl-diphosphatase
VAVAEFGASHADSFWWGVQSLFTRLGGSLVVAAVGVGVGLWGWWRYRNHHFALFMAAIVVGQALLNSGLKLLVGRERPDVLQLAPFSGTSFPSGHSAAAAATYMAAAFVIAIGLRRTQRLLVVAMASFVAAAVGATRALLGVHWLTDVLAGLAVGLAWFVVCAVAFGGRIMLFGELKDEIGSTAEIPA